MECNSPLIFASIVRHSLHHFHLITHGSSSSSPSSLSPLSTSLTRSVFHSELKTGHLTFLFCWLGLFAWCGRLSRLLVGFRKNQCTFIHWFILWVLYCITFKTVRSLSETLTTGISQRAEIRNTDVTPSLSTGWKS